MAIIKNLFIVLLIFNNLFLFSQNVKFKNNFYSILSDSTVSLYSYNVGKSDRFDEILFLDSIVICKKRKYNVVKIEESAFKSKSPTTLIHLNNIKRLDLPLTLSEISSNVFNENFNSLQEITIHHNIKDIGYNTFANLPSLTKIDVRGISKINDWSFSLNPSLSYVHLDTCVNIIGKNAFFNCTRLNTINLENVSFIDEHAFEGISIETLNIPNCKIVGEFAFADCRSINHIELNDSIHLISNFAFINNTALKSIHIPMGIIGESAFMGCTSLNKVVLSDKIESIGQAAFFGCTALRYINIPSTIRKIEAMTFIDCINMEHIILPNNLIIIGESAFEGTGLKEIVIPSSVLEIKNNAFANCRNLKTVILQSDKVKFDDNAFPEDVNIIRR